MGYSGVVYRIFNFAKKIRENSNSMEDLRNTLISILDNMVEKLECLLEYKLNKQNGKRIHYLLARLTDYIEEESGVSSKIDSYLNKGKGKDFEVEHIIADNYSAYSNYFENEEEFYSTRNLIGNLALLQRGTNQSLGNKVFEEKKLRYKGENILLQSLCEETYISNPNFTKFIKEKSFDFIPFEKFSKTEVKMRTELYYNLAKEIWKIENL